MDLTLAVLISLALGIATGAGFVLLIGIAGRRRRSILRALDPNPPAGVERVLEGLGATAFVTDPSHNIVLMTSGAANMGLVQHAGRIDERLGAYIDRCRDTGVPVDDELEVPRGPYGSVELRLHVRVSRLTPRLFIIFVEDRTEAHRVESVRRDFVANVSHELKTPIGAVTLLTEAIAEAADDEEQVRYFTGRLEMEALRLKRLTNELIDLSRLQATDSLEGATIVDTSEILELAIDQARVPAEAKQVRFSVNAPSGLLVFGDAGLLLMAFSNLVSNAVNYSAEGSPVGIGARIFEDAVEVSFTDQGIGIAPEEQARIFERFYRVDPARSRRTGGSGLGLSIVRHIIENHGGDIRVWSRVSKGSTFTVRLPLVRDGASLDDDGFDDFDESWGSEQPAREPAGGADAAAPAADARDGADAGHAAR